ncbi:hypothetical protein [Pandoraea pneumonica]|jgi:hypothetical protein|nr:hypothetical protein [Pandoraea pneumonica]
MTASSLATDGGVAAATVVAAEDVEGTAGMASGMWHLKSGQAVILRSNPP